MPDIDLGRYELDEDSNGNLIVKDPNDNTLFQWDETAGEWDFANQGITGLSEVSTEQATINREFDATPRFIQGYELDRTDITQLTVSSGHAFAADDDQTIISSGSALTNDLSTTGAGGRQSGQTIQQDAWYAIYVIADDDGGSVNTFAVEQSQTLSLPSGYTHYRRIGWAHTQESADRYRLFEHQLPDIFYTGQSNNARVLDSGTPATSWATIDCSRDVPPDAEAAHLKIDSQGDGTAAKYIVQVKHPDMIDPHIDVRAWAGHNDRVLTESAWVPVNASQEIEYQTFGNCADVRISITGWADPR